MNTFTFANQVGPTYIEPFEVVEKISPKRVVVRRLEAKLDPKWKPKVEKVNGEEHVVNNYEQKYRFRRHSRNWKREIHRERSGRWVDERGRQYMPAFEPYRVRDRNF